jgi:ABC-type dipeptide/oligopeptide/nickel transport system permease component
VVVVSLVWVALRMAPGDPVLALLGEGSGGVSAETLNRLREEYGLNDPVLVQYLRFMGDLLRGDLGTSFSNKKPVIENLLQTWPYTFRLAVVATLFSVAFGLPIGVIAATRRNSVLDHLGTGISLAGISLPYFFTALFLMYVFAFKFRWFPVSGTEGWRSLVLPAVSLGIISAAAISRFTRAMMIEALSTDYIRTARAKGLGEGRVLVRHALRNIMIPLITVVGVQFGLLMSGSVITESVFSWPGLGRMMVTAILQRDYSLVQGAAILFAATIGIVNLVVDLLYGFLNPRIRV